MTERLIIDRLGARGDGIAQGPGGPVYVPYALPGEIVAADIAGERGRLIDVLTPSAARIAPICPYFERCGGCVAQHMDDQTYRAWKRDNVLAALARAGIDTPLDEMIDAHGDGRRRATFHARREEGRMLAGFMATRSHDLVAIDVCPVLTPGLARAPAVAAALAQVLARSGKPLDIQVTASDSGLDVDIRGHGPASEKQRLALIEAANALDLARLSLHGDVIVERRAPFMAMGLAQVTPSPGGFLQATALGEDTLGRLVIEGCGKAKRIADLFAGCGPFALRLAQRAEVHAVEQDPAALKALDRAARVTQGLRRITHEARDLFRRPLLAPELERFDAVVFDPPRAGAEAQAKQIALSKIGRAIAVSCDAGTFARDAALLIAGGFRLERVTPVDQFRYSHHVELVGVFTRATGKKR
jgi:23S rRNA (uracil1939-C5)-methyltransferase